MLEIMRGTSWPVLLFTESRPEIDSEKFMPSMSRDEYNIPLKVRQSLRHELTRHRHGHLVW